MMLPSRSSRYLCCALALCSLLFFGTGHALAQTNPTPPAAQAPATAATSNGTIGVAVHASTLGIGGDVALRLNDRANVRAGMDFFSLSHDFLDNDITWAGKISMKSAHLFLDWFPMGGGFHVSPGVVFANSSKATLNASIGAGQRITIGDTDYVGSATNPMKGTGEVKLSSTAAALTIGWGNLVPQGHRFSVPFEIGVTMGAKPTGVLGFTGSACNTNGTNCRDVSTDATIQSEIRKQQASLNDALNHGFLKFYPVLSLGLGIRF